MTFSVTATHTSAYPNEKFKYQWYFNKTNLLTPGMNQISSSTTAATLLFTNVQGSASGLYDVLVTLTSAGLYTNTIRSVPVPLNVLVLNPIQKVNLLGANAGFENAPSFLPFLPFNGCYFAGTPAGSTPMMVPPRWFRSMESGLVWSAPMVTRIMAFIFSIRSHLVNNCRREDMPISPV